MTILLIANFLTHIPRQTINTRAFKQSLQILQIFAHKFQISEIRVSKRMSPTLPRLCVIKKRPSNRDTLTSLNIFTHKT